MEWNNQPCWGVGTPSDLSIADIGVVEGNAGQRSVDVMVSISQSSSNPVTVAYSTRNGTALAGSDYAAANGSVTFAPGDMMKKITLSVNGDVAVEADETFEVVLSNPSGATLANNIGTVTIVNDDFRSGNLSATHLSVYEVRFTYTGYTTFYGTPADCPIRSNGKVVLAGLLEGAENVRADYNNTYRGTLQLDIDMDICSMTGEGDNAKSCGITVIGSGPVKTELQIYYDGRGGYIKVENVSGRFMKNASGSCDAQQINDERNMVPNRTIASVFNGLDLPKLTDRTLRVGRYVESNNGIEIVVEVLRVVRP